VVARVGWREHQPYGRLQEVPGEVDAGAQPGLAGCLRAGPGGQCTDDELDQQVTAAPEAAPVQARQLLGEQAGYLAEARGRGIVQLRGQGRPVPLGGKAAAPVR
jgi:hypothetical protein